MATAQLNVGCNWTPELIEGLIERNQVLEDVVIHSVYGSIPNNFVGTARPAERIPKVSFEEFVGMSSRLRSNNILVNYTINASCIGYVENDKVWERLFCEWVETMLPYIDIFTVAHPLIVELLLKHFPAISVELSTIMNVRTLQQIKYIQDNWTNVEKICMSIERNRDISFLCGASQFGIDIELLANEFCMVGTANCDGLYRQSCYTFHCHNMFNKFDNYPMSRCTASRWKDRASWLRARFVLPQWMSRYQNVCGISSFKISGRTHPTDYILSTVDSYLNREYNGNLLGLWAQLESIWNTSTGQEEAVDKFHISALKLGNSEFIDHWFNNRYKRCTETDCCRCRWCDMALLDVMKES